MPASCPAERDRLIAARLRAAIGNHETIGEAIQWHAAKAVECREMLRDDVHGYMPLKPERIRRLERELYEHECSYQVLFRQQEREILMATATKSHTNGKSGHIAKLLGITPEKAAAIANPIRHEQAVKPESPAARIRRELGLKEKPSVRKEAPPQDDVIDRQSHFLGMDYAELEDEVEPVVPVRASSVEEIEASPEFEAIVDESCYAPVEIQPGRTMQSVFCSPEMASELLQARSRKLQRRLVDADVDLIATDIVEGRWIETGEPIVFNDKGGLVDGQHRLEAIIRAGIGVRLLILRGVPAAAMQAGGGGRRKTKGDVLKSLGATNTSNVAALIDFVLAFNPIDATLSAKPSNMRVKEFYEAHPEMEEAGSYGHKLVRLAHSAVAPAAAYWYFSAIDPDLVRSMYDSLASLDGLDRRPQLKTLHKYLSDNGDRFKAKVVDGKKTVSEENPKRHTLRILAAFVITWNAIRRNKSLGRIQMPREFPQIDGLEV